MGVASTLGTPGHTSTLPGMTSGRNSGTRGVERVTQGPGWDLGQGHGAAPPHTGLRGSCLPPLPLHSPGNPLLPGSPHMSFLVNKPRLLGGPG